VPKKPLMLYYVGRKTEAQLLPSLHGKYDVRYITRLQKVNRWKENGRKEALERFEALQQMKENRKSTVQNRRNQSALFDPSLTKTGIERKQNAHVK
jgi:hypothetical protein